MRQLLVGTTLLTSFLGGIVALLAPCCVSVMLPAYFATSFRRRVGLVAMTLVFAAGVATIIVPLGLGATALSGLLAGHHLLVFGIGGLLMIAGGLFMLSGGKLSLPMPGMRSGSGHGIGATYALGVFSGAASACCAPVLAGVALLSGATGSFVASTAIAATYVFGMVAPLCVLALVWDRRDWGNSRLLRPRPVTLRLWRPSWQVPLSTLLSGLVMTGMGVLTGVLALTGPSMPTSGWQVTLTARLNHLSAVVGKDLAWLPGWAVAGLIAASLTVLVLAARRWRSGDIDSGDIDSGDIDSGDAAVEPDPSCCPPPADRNPAAAIPAPSSKER
jgi:cytochrome c biogenesis protein CcdA